MIKKCKYLTKVTDIANFFINLKIKEGSVCVDATCGNGNDTLSILKKIGNSGKLYAFDIQKEAIENTKKKVEHLKNYSKLDLILDSHENIENYVYEMIDFAIFNLGYLPRGSHEIITKAETTIKALNSLLKLLKEQGMIVVASYIGHEGGKEEYESLKTYLEEIDQNEYNVMLMDFINGKNFPPKLIVIERKYQLEKP